MTFQTESLKRKVEIGRKRPCEAKEEMRIFSCCSYGEKHLRRDCPYRGIGPMYTYAHLYDG